MSLTSANAVILLSIDNVFPTPVQLQGFAADDVSEVEPLDSAEAVMGVDGIMSAGFVFVMVKQGFTLQADSNGNSVFDLWFATQQTARDIFFATGTLILPSVGTKWNMTQGALTSYKSMPDIKRILQPRKFEITWQSIQPGPT